MSALTTSIIVFAVIMAGALLGGKLRSVLPKHHLSDESKDIVKVGIGLLTTLAALVLGLLVATAKSSYDTKSDEVRQAAAKVILLDRNLRQIGAEAKPIRDMLHDLVVRKADLTWLSAEANLVSAPSSSGQGEIGVEALQESLRRLAPANEAQKLAQARALQLTNDLAQLRWVVLEQVSSSIQKPLLVVLVFWLATIACTLGLFAPRNATVLTVTVLCALSVSCAIFLILEMDQPFSGLLRISDAPLRQAISYLERY